MKKSRFLGAVCACFLLFGFQIANANSVDGQLHLSLNPTFNPATDTTGSPTVTVPFNLYVIGDNFTDTNGIGGVEWGLSGIPASWFVLSFTPAPTGINFGEPDVIMGFGTPLTNTGQVLLATYNIIIPFDSSEALLTLGPSTPSSFGGAGPGWAQGANPAILHQFAFSSDLLLYQSQLPTPPGSPPEVPLPAALWLFGSGLVGLIAMARRKKAV
jgi:hypothetical protein